VTKFILKKNEIQNLHLKKNLKFKHLSMFNNIRSKLIEDIDKTTKTESILNKNFKLNFKTKDLNKFKKFKNLAIIGMGGSILGAEAIYQSLKKKIKKKVYFFDNLETQKILDFKNKNKKKILFIIISKSGNTIETLSNLFALNIIEKNKKNIIIISEKKNNILFEISKKFNLFFIEHNKNIGGRYSVLSEVGIVPAYLMGLNINLLRKNLSEHLFGNSNLYLKDSCVKLANIFEQKKIKNLVFCNYAPQFEKFLFWCQQIIAESLGKKNKGFFPIISNTPKDHHSLLQLYLDGPKDKIFYIFSLEETSNIKLITKKLINKASFLNNKKIEEIKIAQKNALIKALKNKKIPFREFKIKKLSEETLSELFSYYILETIILGKLTNINPFDQPAVEKVKIFTKDLLKN